MANFRINKRQDFAQIPNELLKDKSISMEALGLITRLLCNSDSWTSNIRELKNNGSSDWSEYKISKAFKELASLGYAKLVKVYDYNKGCFGGSYYDIYDDKELCKICPKMIYIGEKQTTSNRDPLFYRQSVNDSLINNTNPITILNNNNSLTDLEKKSVCVSSLEIKNDCDSKNPIVNKEIQEDICDFEKFESLWILYRRKGSKIKSVQRWSKLTQSEKDICATHIPKYVSTREISIQKDFESYLFNKTFNDIIVPQRGYVPVEVILPSEEVIQHPKGYKFKTEFQLSYGKDVQDGKIQEIIAYEEKIRLNGFFGKPGEIAKIKKIDYDKLIKEYENKKPNK